MSDWPLFLVSAILNSVSLSWERALVDPRLRFADLPLQTGDLALGLAQDRAAHEPLGVKNFLVRKLSGGLLHLALRGLELLGKPADLALDLQMVFGQLRQLARSRRALFVQKILLRPDARPQRLERLAPMRRGAPE